MDENTLNDLLECSVCLERLDTSSKVLPCQHTFCRKCLEVIYSSRQELRCPECRILVDIKIDDLPPNVLLMRILEGMKNAVSKQNNASNILHRKCEDEETTSKMSTATDEQIQPHQQHSHLLKQTQIVQNSQFQHQHLPLLNPMPPITHQLPPPLFQQQNQQRRCIVPHAYALHDFESNESTDLKFKKGDMILLRRKIDTNWYVGQLKGVEGNFPINYVQVVVPLPSSQCVALYDFKMGPNEEEGCLTFTKGTVIQVLRRVDQNWAEGRIGTAIGIFPIAFVELNHLAKQLLENILVTSFATNTSQQQSRDLPSDMRTVPPIPCLEPSESSASYANTSLSTSATSGQNTNISSSCPTNTSPTLTNSSACESNTVSLLNAVFHSMPNSPQSSGPSTAQQSAQITHASSSVRLHYSDSKHKRHSLNALFNNGSTGLSLIQTNRHSAEILNVPNDFEQGSDPVSAYATGQTTAAREQQHHGSNFSQPHSAQNMLQSSDIPNQQTSSTLRHNVLKTCVQQSIPPSLPWGYLALYPYKPRKNDELELKKGCVYMVTERCLDGWFKGKNWKDVSGVFPGNYVTPLRTRDHQQLMHSWKLIPASNHHTAANAQQQIDNQNVISTIGVETAQQIASSYSISMRNDLENINARLTLANLTPHQPLPPDLPPRYLAASPTNINLQPQVASSKEICDMEAQKAKPTSTGCMSTSSSSSSTGTSSASAGLKKFLTHIKSRSKSPGSAIVVTPLASTRNTYNNAAQPTQLKHQTPKQPQTGHKKSVASVHVRSGSCPSQLLHTLPNDQPRSFASEKKTVSQQHCFQTNSYGSQRLKGSKERPALENSRPTIDSTLRSIYANQVQQQSAMVPSKCGLQFQHQVSPQVNLNSSSQTAVFHRKSHSLDASNLLQPALLNNSISATASTSSLIGAAAAFRPSSLTQCNVNAAAIHASATTKSTQNSASESRFRCVVPYPPNSDVELELHVGDIIFVYRKQKNGWYKGTNSRTYKTGLFPASFVEPDL